MRMPEKRIEEIEANREIRADKNRKNKND